MADSPDVLRGKIHALREEFELALADLRAPSGLQAVRDRYLGRKAGAVTALLKSVGGLPEGARREAGRELNALKADLEARLERVGSALESREREEHLRQDRLDITLPGRPLDLGRRHPLAVVQEELEDIFLAMGYEVYGGREVEDDYHCFEALNMPADHPARDMQDTFYIKGSPGVLLRTHTSSAQIRYMLENPHPPRVRIICPGKVYRRDSDITHSPMFSQVVELVVGPGISVGDLKGTIEAFLNALFGPGYPLRFRPSYFPYTEPSVETDLRCVVCGGSGCRVCKGTGWLEILGSGMVHPAVFEAVNARLGRLVYDPEEVTGFAFGLGIDRVAMVRHGVDDIRLFYENDLRFLEQFRG
ncbi:MAG TPA: phenylalanine--tRNA ligase subunit alpha [Vicinamibacteria bacterium]|nr:phenylalanine--tRNA ligase subunit alpha [Vicinamibacteria bacterium]